MHGYIYIPRYIDNFFFFELLKPQEHLGNAWRPHQLAHNFQLPLRLQLPRSRGTKSKGERIKKKGAALILLFAKAPQNFTQFETAP